MQRCRESIIVPKQGLDDWSFEVDRKIYCARIQGHDGKHSFFNNGKKVEKDD